MDWPRPPPPLRKNSIKKQQPVAGWLPLAYLMVIFMRKLNDVDTNNDDANIEAI